MLIIATCNYDRDDVEDVVIARDVHEHYAKDMVDALNRVRSGYACERWFVAVSDDHKLKLGMEDLV